MVAPPIQASQEDVVIWKPEDEPWNFLDKLYNEHQVKLRNYQKEIILAIFHQKQSIACLPTNTGFENLKGRSF